MPRIFPPVSCIKISFVVVLFLFFIPPALSNEEVGTASKISGRVYTNNLLQSLNVGDPVDSSDVIITSKYAAAIIDLKDGSQLVIGGETKVTLKSFSIPENGDGLVTGTLQVMKGFLRFVGGDRAKRIEVISNQTVFSIRGTVFDVLGTDSTSTAFVEEGTVTGTTKGEATVIDLGESLTVGQVSGRKGKGIPENISAAKRAIEALIGPLPTKIDRRELGILVSTTKGDFVIDLENDDGLVQQIRKLILSGYYKGLPFDRVFQNTLVQLEGPPASDDNFITFNANLYELEFTPFAVGLIASPTDKHITGRFFVALKALRHLDGKFPVAGYVVNGVDVLNSFAGGNPPAKPERIKNVTEVRISVWRSNGNDPPPAGRNTPSPDGP